MTDKQEKIDIYECSLYRQDMSFWCKYYPKGCNECGDLIKVGERILNDKEINMTTAKQIIDDVDMRWQMFHYRRLHWKENQSYLKNWKIEIEYVTDEFSLEQLNKVTSQFLRKGVNYEFKTFYDNGIVFITIKYKVIDNLKFWLKELFKRGEK